MRDRYEVILKKNGKRVELPISTVWIEDDGKIFPCPSCISTSKSVFAFIRKFDPLFDHAMSTNYTHMDNYT